MQTICSSDSLIHDQHLLEEVCLDRAHLTSKIFQKDKTSHSGLLSHKGEQDK